MFLKTPAKAAYLSRQIKKIYKCNKDVKEYKETLEEGVNTDNE